MKDIEEMSVEEARGWLHWFKSAEIPMSPELSKTLHKASDEPVPSDLSSLRVSEKEQERISKLFEDIVWYGSKFKGESE